MPDASELTSHLLLQLTVILAACLVTGRLLRRVGLPQVVADMAAGFLLGPALLGLLAPGLSSWLFPGGGASESGTPTHPSMLVLYAVGQLGLVLAMFFVGLEMERAVAARTARGALLTAAAGLTVPLLLGGWLGWYLADDTALFPEGTRPVQAALLCGTALSVTAFPVLARMVKELGMDRAGAGTVALSAAAMTDAVAWVLLAALLAGADGSVSAAAWSTVALAVYTVLVLGPGRRLLERLALLPGGGRSPYLLPLALLLLLGCAFLTERWGVHGVLGAFVLGLAMPRGATAHALREHAEPLVRHLLMPVFFVCAGLTVHPEAFREGVGLGLLAVVVLLAFAGKAVPCALALRSSGFGWREAAATGALMNARGVMELVVIEAALRHGLITRDFYTVLALMTLLSTVAAPLSARWLSHRPPTGPGHDRLAPLPAGRPPHAADPVPPVTEGKTAW